MTEHDRDDEISRRYRDLAREEPPRALDDAILAASRRAVEARPAPLVAPTGRRRWRVPVAAAAVIVLTAVLTLHVQREQPDEELSAVSPAPPAAQKEQKAAAAAPAEVQQDKLAARPGETEAYREKKDAAKAPTPERRRAKEPAPAPAIVPSIPPAAAPAPALADRAQPRPPADPGRFAPDPAPSAAPPLPAAQMQMRPAEPAAKPAPRAAEATAGAGERRAMTESRDSMRQREELGSVAKRADLSEPPERMLERIATLRREGRHKDADELYTEFKRRFPDYRIPEAMREQVLPR